MGKREVKDNESYKLQPLKKEAKTETLLPDLEFLCDTIDISPKSRVLLVQQGITTVSILLSKFRELSRAELPQINKAIQSQLHKFCSWHDKLYERCDRSERWEVHFAEDSLSKFDEEQLKNAASSDSGGLLGKDLEIVCEAIEVSKPSRVQLAQLGIKTVQDLLDRKTDLELSALYVVKKMVQKHLLRFCLWHEDFYRKNGAQIAWEDQFNDEVFAKFEQEPSLERDYRMAVERIHDGRGDGCIVGLDESVYEYGAAITARYLTKQLVLECQEKFNPYDVALKCHRALLHPTGKPHGIVHVVSGRTQSGKSTVKAVIAAVHRQLSCFLIVITKGIPERDDLRIKLNRLLGGCRETMEAGLLVVADTGANIEKAIKALTEIRKESPNKRFGIIVDEADAMYRTVDGIQYMERRYVELMNMGPSFRMEISATIFSALQALDEQGKEVELMEVLTTKDYSGINEMELFRDSNGKVVFLKDDEISAQHGVRYSAYKADVRMYKNRAKAPAKVLFAKESDLNLTCKACLRGSGCEKHSDIASKRWRVGKQTHIPYTSTSMMDFLNQALQAGKKGVLILVATNPRVYAEKNVLIQAACIQNHFRSDGRDIAVLAATGRGMEARLPGCGQGRFIRRKLKTVSEIIDQVDKQVGHEIPIVIFGYSRMCRCVSFRNNTRVPTAMILHRGPGYSLEDYIQGLGRATFNGLSVLRKNGHEQVTILTSNHDFIAAKKYYNFVQAVYGMLSKHPGRGLMDAFRGAKERFPDDANFFRHTNRKIGRRKDLGRKGPGQENFEQPCCLEEESGDRKAHYWKNKVVQRVFAVFLEMADDDETFHCYIEQLTESYNKSFPSEHDKLAMKNNGMKAIMRALHKDVIFTKVERGDDGRVQWSAKSLKELTFLINKDVDELPDDHEEERDKGRMKGEPEKEEGGSEGHKSDLGEEEEDYSEEESEGGSERESEGGTGENSEEEWEEESAEDEEEDADYFDL